MFQAQIADVWAHRATDMSYFHYVKNPVAQRQPKTTGSEESRAVPPQQNARPYPQLLKHYYHGPLNTSKARALHVRKVPLKV